MARIDTINQRLAVPSKTKANIEIKISGDEDEDDNEEGELLEEVINNHMNMVDKIQQIPFMQSLGNLLTNWAHGNKAVSILCLVPLFALSTKWAFRKRTYNRDYNFVELLFAQTYAACQVLLISILLPPVQWQSGYGFGVRHSLVARVFIIGMDLQRTLPRRLV